MQLKMKDLILQSGESKSTILYYIKEGLLPEPCKPKPNVHLYDQNCIETIKFIKYLQHNFSYSIIEIKSIFEDSNFNVDGSFEMMIKSLEIISGGKENQWYEKEDFLELTSISEETLVQYRSKGYLFERAKGFSSKEIEIVKILQHAEEVGLDFLLLENYVMHAKTVAKQEFETGSKLMKSDENAHSEHYELLFDLVLTLKPYLFNMYTVSEHQSRYTEEEK